LIQEQRYRRRLSSDDGKKWSRTKNIHQTYEKVNPTLLVTHRHFRIHSFSSLARPKLATFLSPRMVKLLKVIKASPKNGSSGGVIVLFSVPAGFETTFPAHKRADELFCIMDGYGIVELDSMKYEIGSGSVNFVPT
jgi:mannose-6-phosphate isomerase-like protein (cupin superfamily)